MMMNIIKKKQNQYIVSTEIIDLVKEDIFYLIETGDEQGFIWFNLSSYSDPLPEYIVVNNINYGPMKGYQAANGANLIDFPMPINASPETIFIWKKNP